MRAGEVCNTGGRSWEATSRKWFALLQNKYYVGFFLRTNFIVNRTLSLPFVPVIPFIIACSAFCVVMFGVHLGSSQITLGQRHNLALVHLEEINRLSAKRTMSCRDENVEALSYRCMRLWGRDRLCLIL